MPRKAGRESACLRGRQPKSQVQLRNRQTATWATPEFAVALALFPHLSEADLEWLLDNEKECKLEPQATDFTVNLSVNREMVIKLNKL